MNKLFLKSVIIIGGFLASQSQAGLMLETYGNSATPTTVGGYEMTDFNFDEGGFSTSTVISPLSGSLNIKDINGNPLSMNVGTADDTSWWINNEASNYTTYTTSVNWLEIFLPENTLAFSFTVGANKNAGAWLTAEDSNGFGLLNANNGVENFSISTTYSPSFGVYADNSNATAGNCSYVSSIVIDPVLVWGVGNLSIAQGNCVTNVPEPSILALMGLGLFSLVMLGRKAKKPVFA